MKQLIVVLLTATALGAHAQTFVKQKRTVQVGPYPSEVLIAQLDAKGAPEIISADRGRLADVREQRPAHDQLSLLQAESESAYERVHQLTTGFGPYAIKAADVDRDGRDDLVVVNFMGVQNRDLTLLRNIGDGLFEPVFFDVFDEAVHYHRMLDGDGVPIFPSPGLTSLDVGDIDGDGRLDVVASGWASDVIAIFRGIPERYLEGPRLIPCPGGPRDLRLRDMDRDGSLDLAIALYSANEVAVWKGDGKGEFTEAARFQSRGRLPNRVLVEDFNSDGQQDIAVTHRHADDSVAIFYASTAFRFDVSQEILVGENRGAVEHGISDALAEDLNGDGAIDIALACPQSRSVIVLLQKGKGNAGLPAFVDETYKFEPAEPRGIAAGDLDADGKQDLAVTLWGPDSVALLLGR